MIFFKRLKKFQILMRSLCFSVTFTESEKFLEFTQKLNTLQRNSLYSMQLDNSLWHSANWHSPIEKEKLCEVNTKLGGAPSLSPSPPNVSEILDF